MSELSRIVAVTKCPRTAPCAAAVTERLQTLGRTVQTFVADGSGGRELEAAIRAGRVAAVIELSLTELAAELLETGYGAGPDRLTAAALTGIPQLIVPGGLDGARMDSGPRRSVRKYASFDDQLFIQTTPEEIDRLGQEIAFKASASSGPVTILFPRGGLSTLDCSGGPFWQPECIRALGQSLRSWLSPNVTLLEISAHLSDEVFVKRVLAEFARQNADP